MKIDTNILNEMETRKRAMLINSLGGFKSLCLIGSKNSQMQSNLAVFNSFFHLGAHPPLFGFIIRPDSVERHTYENIIETKFFTINHVHEGIYKQAHQTSARYPREQSEFEATKLSQHYEPDFFAPFVAESNIRIAAEFKESKPIELNHTILMIAAISAIYFPEECWEQDGFVDIEKAGTITCGGLDAYYRTQRIARLSYAKPHTEPTPLFL